ncbi:MAG: peroxiredoxin [Candidatus Thiodiazotropha sp. (ex Monitilora ramsayi)]|nr:peroxiredoxin [Candidatus Thiodiazotropha sp. (ex Monitilora ramsayi)]
MLSQSSFFLIVLGLFSFGQVKADVSKGELAPDFRLMDQNGEVHRLSAYQGGWVVLYFYPKDDTPGCTKEACEFRDDHAYFVEKGVTLLGVSTDDIESHQAFSEKYQLPFPLLSDADGEVAKQYGSLFQIGPIKFAKRHSFIIDPKGRIARIYRDVDPKQHSDQMIADLTPLVTAP